MRAGFARVAGFRFPWTLAALAVGLFEPACSPLLGFPEVGSETGVVACSDGVDNDFDGKVDCEDPDCLCDRCGPIESPHPTDSLGQVCAEDCECPPGDVCNLSARLVSEDGAVVPAGRCSSDVNPDENAFDIGFVFETEGNGSPQASGAQNVYGRIRYEGREAPIVEIQRWAAETIDLRGASDSDGQPTLFVQLFPIPLPPLTLALTDDLGERRRSTVQLLRANFGFVPPGEPSEILSLNQRAVVQTSTLSVTETTLGVWRGRFRGTLREATAFDRAKDPGECTDGVYDPRQNQCQPVDRVRMYFGCPLLPAPPSSSRGRIAFAWEPFQPGWDRRSASGVGECVAVRFDREVVVRARTNEWMVEYRFESSRLGQNVGFEGIPMMVWALPVGAGDVPLFDVDLGPPDRWIEGQFWIDGLREGDDGRLFAWIRGSLTEPR